MYCIVLNKYFLSSILLSVDNFNLKFKKQSEKLKHYEGEHCENRGHDDDERREMIGAWQGQE